MPCESMIAAQLRHADLVEVLLQACGAAVHVPRPGMNRNTRNPMWVVGGRGRPPKPSRTPVLRQDGATPLYIAAEHCHVPVARLLLDGSAAPNEARHDGTSPLFIAAERGCLEMVRIPVPEIRRSMNKGNRLDLFRRENNMKVECYDSRVHGAKQKMVAFIAFLTSDPKRKTEIQTKSGFLKLVHFPPPALRCV